MKIVKNRNQFKLEVSQPYDFGDPVVYKAPYTVDDIPAFVVYDDTVSENKLLGFKNSQPVLFNLDKDYRIDTSLQNLSIPDSLYNAVFEVASSNQNKYNRYFEQIIKIDENLGMIRSGFLKLIRPINNLNLIENASEIKTLDKIEESIIEDYILKPTNIYQISELINKYRLNKLGKTVFNSFV